VFLAHTDLQMIGTSLHADGRLSRLHADGPALVEDWTAQILESFAPRFTKMPLAVMSMPAPACHGWRCPRRKVCSHEAASCSPAFLGSFSIAPTAVLTSAGDLGELLDVRAA